ncbi:NHL repeat-containing protein [Seonamhaeicola marinus]|uniref:ATP-binding protein n=1 Tax=Seonamhaeicola marinus TaxID=1912246 RepID=A0A5D0I9G7_9FLAO|nr:hypothetical protein [Seonamhaeicola marinus]TYA78392.1 hypothetical protein FUA24_08525 [Seonamhaeicola marinus]
MKNLVVVLLVTLSILMSCNNKSKSNEVKAVATTENITPSLELVWETDTLMTTCEAVLYDKASQTIFVSNINNNPWGKDGNGFISTLNTKGEITDLKWVEGVSGPKGLGISNGNLYVNDIDQVVEINMASKSITNRFTMEGTPQLNDITVDDKGVVYASGSGSNTIYKLENEALVAYASDTLNLKRLNGLLFQSEGMYYLDSGTQHFGMYDNASNTFKKLTEGIGHGDGIVKLENGDFITSSWKGEIYYINAKDWTKTKLLDTKEASINAADIDFIPETKTLIVPTFFHNTVRGYKVTY